MRLDGALWLRIIFKALLPEPKMAHQNQKMNQKSWLGSCWDNSWICIAFFVIRRGWKMSVSHIPPSNLDMSSYRAIWTHFRQNFILFGRKISDPGKSKLFLKCKSSHSHKYFTYMLSESCNSSNSL